MLPSGMHMALAAGVSGPGTDPFEIFPGLADFIVLNMYYIVVRKNDSHNSHNKRRKITTAIAVSKVTRLVFRKGRIVRISTIVLAKVVSF